MRAAVQTRYGPPDVVQIHDVPRPATKDNELLVKVHATTVNRTDCGYRAARPFVLRVFTGWTKPRRTVLGTEFAGVVEAIGSRVTSFQIGDRVFGYCEGRFGAHAEYMTMPEAGLLAAIPSHMSFEDAAPATEGSHYALAFIRTARVRSGQDVLVYGATGGIGSAAVQLVKALGANVTAVCAGAHGDLVKGLGADRVVDYTATDFTNDEQRYDVVMDAVGKSTFGRCKRLLKPNGVYLSSELGPYGQNLMLPLVTSLRGRKVKFPFPKDDPGMARHIKDLMESGAFKPVIDRRYPLDQIVEAYRYVESGQKIGNVVITLPA
jgi:NADPH:quinone reductase-like Zn-dependent oxidoreductase